jgi:hypothetical protein
LNRWLFDQDYKQEKTLKIIRYLRTLWLNEPSTDSK